jgi:flagellar motor switch protein FliN
MDPKSPALEQFLKTWLAEFGRAIEMFTGQQPSLSFSAVDSVSIAKNSQALWLKQTFAGESEFETWIGAQDVTWMELGKALGDGPVESLRSTYLEIVNQAQQGTATVTSLGLPTPVQCGTAETLPTAHFDASSYFLFDLELIDNEYPPIVIAIERTALKVLDATLDSSVEIAPTGSEVKKLENTNLQRIGELSLPVSVSVGSTKLDIRNALRTRAGSVITLSKEVSDLVELLVDGVIVARGELVVVKGNYGFRVKQIVTRRQRISLCSN